MQYQRIKKLLRSAIVVSVSTTCLIATSVKADQYQVSTELSTEVSLEKEETESEIALGSKVVLVLQEVNNSQNTTDLSQILNEISNLSPEEEEIVEEAVEEREEELEKEESVSSPTSVPGESYSNMVPHEHDIVVDSLIIEKVSCIMYPTTDLNVREQPNTECEIIGGLTIKDEIEVIGEIPNNDFVQIKYGGATAFVCKEYLSEEQTKPKVEEYHWDGKVLAKGVGTVIGPSGKETYYNQNMSGVIRLMNALGYYDEYWVNDQGLKCWGPYIMAATDTYRYPKGTILPSSRGMCCIVDHCVSAESYGGIWLDLAVTW